MENIELLYNIYKLKDECAERAKEDTARFEKFIAKHKKYDIAKIVCLAICAVFFAVCLALPICVNLIYSCGTDISDTAENVISCVLVASFTIAIVTFVAHLVIDICQDRCYDKFLESDYKANKENKKHWKFIDKLVNDTSYKLLELSLTYVGSQDCVLTYYCEKEIKNKANAVEITKYNLTPTWVTEGDHIIVNISDWNKMVVIPISIVKTLPKNEETFLDVTELIQDTNDLKPFG